MFSVASTARNENWSEPYRRICSHEQELLDIVEKTRTSILPWRGQFSPQLVEFLITQNAPSCATILDPFCGSGTVLYEAAAMGHNSIGLDINPAAVNLAATSEICRHNRDQRNQLETFISDFRIECENCAIDGKVSAERITDLYRSGNYDGIHNALLKAFLMCSFGNSLNTATKSFSKGENAIKRLLDNAPFSKSLTNVYIGDARRTEVPDGSVDYVITSPPYINVFNYHQNYRPIMECFGEKPLHSARAEFGSNRKHRGNRYLTVIQYCIDIESFLFEARRVLRENGKLTIVLGRESNVRGVPFMNGKLVHDIATSSVGASITDWKQRKFMNRFGADIYEDIFTMKFDKPISKRVGREIGRKALVVASRDADDSVMTDIVTAIENASNVIESPYVMEEKNV